MCLSNYYVTLELLTAIYDCELIFRKLSFISYIICHKLVVYYFFKFWSPEPHGMFSQFHRRAHLKQWEQDKACLSKQKGVERGGCAYIYRIADGSLHPNGIHCKPSVITLLLQPILVTHRPKAFGFLRKNTETAKMRISFKNFLWLIKRQ